MLFFIGPCPYYLVKLHGAMWAVILSGSSWAVILSGSENLSSHQQILRSTQNDSQLATSRLTEYYQ